MGTFGLLLLIFLLVIYINKKYTHRCSFILIVLCMLLDIVPIKCKNLVVSALRQVPKPGYGLAPRSHTFSSATTTGSARTGAPVSF